MSQRSEWASVVVRPARQHDYLIFELHGYRAMGGFRLISINELSWLFARGGWVCFVSFKLQKIADELTVFLLLL